MPRGARKKRLWLLGLPILAAMSVLVANNWDLIREALHLNRTSGSGTGMSATGDSIQVFFTEPPGAPQGSDSVGRREEPSIGPVGKLEQAVVPEFSWDSGPIICPLRSEPMLYVILEVRLRYSDEKLGKELKFREPNIKAIIQNILFTRTRDELKIPGLRKNLLSSINDLLPTQAVEDLVFTDFKLEIRQK